MNLHASYAVIAVMACVLAACETTGNPREGGFFGWSEHKAQEREEGLRRDLDASTRAAQEEQAKTHAIQEQKRDVQTEVSQLQSQLDKLFTENHQLEAELNHLVRRRQVKGEQLARIRMQLAENERIRKQVRLNSATQSRQKTDAAVALVAQQNQRLHQEILFLLGM